MSLPLTSGSFLATVFIGKTGHRDLPLKRNDDTSSSPWRVTGSGLAEGSTQQAIEVMADCARAHQSSTGGRAALESRLADDGRHRNMRVLGTDLSTDRAFTSWIMETPKVRPAHAALLKRLVEGCESLYGLALRMRLDMARVSRDAEMITG